MPYSISTSSPSTTAARARSSSLPGPSLTLRRRFVVFFYLLN
ncbi:hypothetical protein LINPERHAP1_LOCUS11825 [Linum perenne]